MQSDLLDDLAIISMSLALFNVAQEDSGDGIITVEEEPISAQKIKYRMNKLSNRLLKLMRKYKAHWNEIEPRQKRLLEIAVKSEHDTIQPDYLATYILRFRFLRTKRVLHQDVEWLQSKGSELLGLLELLDKTQVADREEEMCDLAFNLAKI